MGEWLVTLFGIAIIFYLWRKCIANKKDDDGNYPNW
jgi:hypothetical protein